MRPYRRAHARAGVEQLPWLFTATFAATLLLVPLFGWIVARVPRRVIATATYALCSGLLLVTYAGLQGAGIVAWGVGLFIGISVLNLFIISVFWSVMADAYDEAEARKMYGIIAAGGTAGAIAGPALTALLAPRIGPMNLLPISAAFLGLAAVLSTLIPRAPPRRRNSGSTGLPRELCAVKREAPESRARRSGVRRYTWPQVPRERIVKGSSA